MIQIIKKWKSPTLACESTSNQSRNQLAAILKGSPRSKKLFVDVLALYLTEISWQAAAVSQLEGNRRTLYI